MKRKPCAYERHIECERGLHFACEVGREIETERERETGISEKERAKKYKNKRGYKLLYCTRLVRGDLFYAASHARKCFTPFSQVAWMGDGTHPG